MTVNGGKFHVLCEYIKKITICKGRLRNTFNNTASNDLDVWLVDIIKLVFVNLSISHQVWAIFLNVG